MLRWIPESNAWGCDRCQRMFPAAPAPRPQPQQAYQPPPQQAYQPAPQQHQPAPYQQQPQPYHQPPQQHSPYAPGSAPQGAYVPPAPGHAVPPVSQAKPKSKTGLLVVLALLVVGGGATAAILVLKGGGGSLGGESSSDALVTKILAALDAGDGAALVALAADESRSDDFMDCGDKKKKGDDKEDKERVEHRKKRAREDADKLAAGTKGKGYVLDETMEEKQNRGSTIKKGEKIGGEDCTSTIEVAFHDLKLKVHDATKKKATVAFDTVVLDGHWFLGRAPKIEEAGDCAGAVGHMLGITKADLVKSHMDVAKLTEAMVRHCEKDAWADKTVNCFAGAKVSNDADSCMAMLTSSQSDAVTKDMVKLMQEGNAAVAPPPPPPPPPDDKAGSDTPAPGSDPPAPGADGLPSECDDYAKTVERVMACKLMPQASRDAMKQALDGMRSNNKNLPPDALKAVGDACKQGNDALKQAMQGIGC